MASNKLPEIESELVAISAPCFQCDNRASVGYVTVSEFRLPLMARRVAITQVFNRPRK